MALIDITARFRCDGCNEEFECGSLDSATEFVAGTSLHEYVMDVLRGGDGMASGGPSEQGDHDLCPNCTKYIDDKFPDQANLTYDQVCGALNERAGV